MFNFRPKLPLCEEDRLWAGVRFTGNTQPDREWASNLLCGGLDQQPAACWSANPRQDQGCAWSPNGHS